MTMKDVRELISRLENNELPAEERADARIWLTDEYARLRGLLFALDMPDYIVNGELPKKCILTVLK